MKLLVLSRYSRLGASSRVRLMQYIPSLELAGVDVTVCPLFSDAYVSDLQRDNRSLIKVVPSYARRINALWGSRAFDLLWIEKEALPWLPVWVETILLSSHVPYVLDYDDAVFHYYDQHRRPVVKRLLGGKHAALMRRAAAVVVGNEYLADFARLAGARCIEIVPSVIDMARYQVACRTRENHGGLPPCVCWIGQRATALFLRPYAQLFEALSAAGEARFSAIGIDATSLGFPMASIPWTEQTEVAAIASFDIGIMPLADEPFERGKCGYKLVQYMACGLPVVASPVGVNRQLVEHGVNGYLAETLQQWEQALALLLADPTLRQRMGRAGRQKVERDYCIQVTGPKVTTLLMGAASASKKDK